MKNREEISQLLKTVFKEYSGVGNNAEMNTSYISNMLIIELLCDIRELLEDEMDERKAEIKNRKTHSKPKGFLH